jgi:CHASE3 domain sensor protein
VKLSVRTKLFGGFGVVLALLAVVVAVALNTASSLGSAHSVVTGNVLPVVQAAAASRTSASDEHFSQTRYVLVPSGRAPVQKDQARLR